MSIPTPGTGARPTTTSPVSTAGNSYAHNVSKTNVGNEFDIVKLNTQFLSNILDNYDSITYHWKFFITTPEAASNGTIFDNRSQVIIAETGVTDLIIDKVEINSITTPSVLSGTGTATDVRFEIVEPAGAGLIDKLYYQSLALGIGNWAVMPVYLQLQFRARSSVDSSPDGTSKGSIGALKWVWCLKLTNIKANVKEVGTTYQFEAIIYDEFAQSNSVFSLQHNTVLPNVDYFDHAMNMLQEKLNNDQVLKLIDNYSIPDTYQIIVDPAIAKFRIKTPSSNKDSKRNNNFVNFDNKDASFVAGTSIDKVIDSLLAQTEEYQQKLLSSSDNKNPSEDTSLKKFWRIITETRPLAFDPRRQDNAKEFTIYVVEYDIGVLDSPTSSTENSIAAERKRIMSYVNKSILKKRYDYIFTGLNDQILDFDITINNAFAMTMARLGGLYSNAAMSDKGVVNHDTAQEESRITEMVSKVIALQNNATKSSSKETADALKEAQLAISKSKIDDATKNRYRILLEKAKPATLAAFLRDTQRAGGINDNGEFNRTRMEATMLARPIKDTVSGAQYTFISDVDVTKKSIDKLHDKYTKQIKGRLRPIARAESIHDRQVGAGVESSSNPGIQKLSSMFSVALHSGQDASFQTMKMTIKGDPFWLFPQPTTSDAYRISNRTSTKEEAIQWIKQAHFRVNDAVNIYGSDNFILVRFRAPNIYSVSSGDADPNSDIETFSGVYKVVKISSKFEEGAFVQVLECILDPEIRILNIQEQVEKESAKPSKTTTPNTISGQGIPSNAVRQPRV